MTFLWSASSSFSASIAHSHRSAGWSDNADALRETWANRTWPYNRAVSGHDEDPAPAGTPPSGSPLDDRRVAWGLIALLIAVRVAAILWGLDRLPADEAGTGLGNDARRFHDITTTAGRPYRDFPVEIPPVAIGAIELLDPGSSRTLATNLAVAMLACDLATAAMLGLTWGRRTALTYLVLGAPLAIFVYFRLDLLSVALAVAAVVAARRGAQRTAGLTLAAAALTKVWPVVLLPLLAIHRRSRAVAFALGRHGDRRARVGLVGRLGRPRPGADGPARHRLGG